MKHIIDKNYFPGWVRKSVTFTIDDGNVEMDKKFLDIVRPAGILGTFNLCYSDRMSPAEYREMYSGYEISNHVIYHPEIFVPGADYVFSEEPFNKETADIKTVYRHPDVEGAWIVNGYYYGISTERWLLIVDPQRYNQLMDETNEKLNAIFGEGAVRSFVWPFGQQFDYKDVLKHVKDIGYYGARDAGMPVKSFSLPSDRLQWKYCAMDHDLVVEMEKYENLPDDGELKFFSFGVHSIDYERNGTWKNLTEFCERYSKHSEKYYYGTVGKIFDYEDAIKSIVITDKEINNPSGLPVYIKVDGNPLIIEANSSYKF